MPLFSLSLFFPHLKHRCGEAHSSHDRSRHSIWLSYFDPPIQSSQRRPEQDGRGASTVRMHAARCTIENDFSKSNTIIQFNGVRQWGRRGDGMTMTIYIYPVPSRFSSLCLSPRLNWPCSGWWIYQIRSIGVASLVADAHYGSGIDDRYQEFTMDNSVANGIIHDARQWSVLVCIIPVLYPFSFSFSSFFPS